MNRVEHRLQQGFTLIELMVVVVIIGILLAAGVLAFVSAQRNARDSRRIADIVAIGRAMEQYNSQYGSYPTGSVNASISPFFPSNSVPVDSKGASYTITVGSGSTFCACAALERTGAGNASSLGSGGTCAYITNGNYFCASQRQ